MATHWVLWRVLLRGVKMVVFRGANLAHGREVDHTVHGEDLFMLVAKEASLVLSW